MRTSKYTQMQKEQYDNEANNWNIHNRDPVVGVFDQHNNWSDYDNFLFKEKETKNKLALDFGCGPGRSIVKFANRFSRIDGCDISQKNLDNAVIWTKHHNISFEPNLYQVNGTDLTGIDSEIYDVVYSTICMQHICVHQIRCSLLQDFYRVLKSGGFIAIQMGYGDNGSGNVRYLENFIHANGTNGQKDVMITQQDIEYLKFDLEEIGFVDFEYDIRDVGPGDRAHINWIFFRATKP